MNRSKQSLALLTVVTFLLTASSAMAQRQRMDQYQKSLEGSLSQQLTALNGEEQQSGPRNRANRMTAKVNINDSDRGDAKDIEVVLTMPIQDFNAFAPTAFCEAVATPHGFPTNYIYVRNSDTGKTGRVAFADVESLAGQYKSGPKQKANAEAEMARKIIWH